MGEHRGTETGKGAEAGTELLAGTRAWTPETRLGTSHTSQREGFRTSSRGLSPRDILK